MVNCILNHNRLNLTIVINERISLIVWVRLYVYYILNQATRYFSVQTVEKIQRKEKGFCTFYDEQDGFQKCVQDAVTKQMK